MTKKDWMNIEIAREMVNDRICGVLLDGEDFPVVDENHTKDNEGWMRIIAEQRGFPTEDLPYDVIWKVYSRVVLKAIKETAKKCKEENMNLENLRAILDEEII